METRRIRVEGGKVLLFEFDNVYVGLGTIAALLRSVDGVSSVRVGRSQDPAIRITFTYQERQVVVEEPYGDSSVYWVGAAGEGEPVDVTAIERVLAEYRPPALVQWLGDLVLLKKCRRK